ncbi:MAG: hypothetical protein HRT98_03370 [Mycoplasmatales bacterium]|nr:hypothetical protein [Mycoplasmatales bacterium]
MKKTVEKKRIEEITKMMKNDTYKYGFRLEQLWKEIEKFHKNEKNGDDIFGIEENKTWKNSIRRLLQQTAPNSRCFAKKTKFFI